MKRTSSGIRLSVKIFAFFAHESILGTNPMDDAMTRSQASGYFFKNAIEYYAAARFAVVSRLTSISGVLFHHAVERLLKGKLADNCSSKELSKDYRHDLVKTWNKFKTLFPQDELASFDDIIADLDRFESIRYPDSMVEKGAVVTVAWAGNKLPGRQWLNDGQHYRFSMDELDRLVARIIELCSNEPLTKILGLSDDAKRFVEMHNESYESWFCME